MRGLEPQVRGVGVPPHCQQVQAGLLDPRHCFVPELVDPAVQGRGHPRQGRHVGGVVLVYVRARGGGGGG